MKFELEDRELEFKRRGWSYLSVGCLIFALGIMLAVGIITWGVTQEEGIHQLCPEELEQLAILLGIFIIIGFILANMAMSYSSLASVEENKLILVEIHRKLGKGKKR